MLLLAAILLWAQFGPIAIPDTNKATFDEMIAFIESDNFADLSTNQRKSYLDAMAARFTALTPNEQTKVDKRWKALPRELRRSLSRNVEMAIGTQLAKQYRQTPPEQRDHFAAQLMWMFTASPAISKDAEQWFSGDKISKAFKGNIRKHQHSIYNNSTAEDRAMLIDLTSRISKEYR